MKPVYPLALLGFEDRGMKDLGAKVGDLLFAKLQVCVAIVVPSPTTSTRSTYPFTLTGQNAQRRGTL
jgi:hypothetical protein